SAPRLIVWACPTRLRQERANLAKSIAGSIVTRTSTSLGIALAVRMEPRSEIRCTPGQARAASMRQVLRAAAGGAARRLKVKERGVGCDAFCSKQVSEGARYRYSFQRLIQIGSMPKVIE